MFCFINKKKREWSERNKGPGNFFHLHWSSGRCKDKTVKSENTLRNIAISII